MLPGGFQAKLQREHYATHIGGMVQLPGNPYVQQGRTKESHPDQSNVHAPPFTFDASWGFRLAMVNFFNFSDFEFLGFMRSSIFFFFFIFL
jgi:hypothetical protein